MVLQFGSLQDCLDFSDCFVDQNLADDDEAMDDPAKDIAALAADGEAVAAHLVRLLHEPHFEAFVRNVETSLQGTTDGEEILQSWVGRDFGTVN